MGESWRCDHLPTDHVIAVVDHAENMIEEWTRRRDQAMAELAIRGEIVWQTVEP